MAGAALLRIGAPSDGDGIDDVLAAVGAADVCSGSDALRAIAGGAVPELLLLAGDTDLTRLEVLRGLHGLRGPAMPPCIVLVEPGREDLLARALEAGAADTVMLPFRANDLEARIRARIRGGPAAPPSAATPRMVDVAAFSGPPSRPVTAEGGFLFGLVLVVSELALGSMTRVLKGVRLADGTLAALKVLDPQVAATDEDWARRFAREQQLLRGIDHPNLVRIRDVGTLEGLPYVDMDYFPGTPLDELIHATGRFETDRAIDIGLGIARGLQALHALQIVHRDIKPENVLVDTQGHTRVCDFGLSKPHDDAGLTQEGEILGTVAFIAPEILTGDAPSAESDVYALGVTLFEMVTGEEAIPHGNAHAMFEAAVKGTAQSRALTLVPERLRTSVSRMLAVRPGDRYSHMDHLIRDLERAKAP